MAKKFYGKKIVLIYTNGYTINYDNSFLTMDDARKEMRKQYDENIPNGGLEPEWKDMSSCGVDDAILYANGEDVHVWRIIIV